MSKLRFKTGPGPDYGKNKTSEDKYSATGTQLDSQVNQPCCCMIFFAGSFLLILYFLASGL